MSMARDGEKEVVGDRQRFTTTVIPSTLGVCALVLATVSIWSTQHVGLVVAIWCLLLVLVFGELRLKWIADTLVATKQQDGTPPRLFSSALAVWLLLAACLGIGYQEPVSTLTPMQNLLAIAVMLGVLGFSVILLNYFASPSSDAFARNHELGCWCRATVWIGTVALVLALSSFADPQAARKPAFQSMMIISLLPALEWLFRFLASEDGRVSLSKDVRLVTIVFGRLNPVASLLDWFQTRFSVDIRSTWAISVFRQAILPVTSVLLLLGWLMTSVTTIDSTQVGFQERFGSPISEQALEPGLHIKAPWPVDQIRLVDNTRIRTMTLGFSEPKADASLLWTKQHAREEYNLLLGDGRDLITINALLHYRINDPWAWHYETQNPEEMLGVAAEQALLKNTVSRTLNDTLSENTSLLVDDIQREIQRSITEYGIGVEVIDLAIQGLHPPVSIADEYQAVVGAQHERETSILESNSYRIERINHANTEAANIIRSAQAAQLFTTSGARAETDAYLSLLQTHKDSASALELLLRLQALEKIVASRPVFIIDDRIEDSGAILWFEN